MTSHRKSVLLLVGMLLICTMVLFGCAPSPARGSAGSTPTGSAGSSGSSGHVATHTPAPPPPHALAWFQTDSHGAGQIWASINGGAAHQITHMPASTAECRYDRYWSPPVFSPDLSKIVAAWGSDACTDGPQHGPLYIINAHTGAATTVPSADYIRLSTRQAGWIDNAHIWWIDGSHVYRHTLGSTSSTTLGALGGNYAEDAVLRGSTLFYTTHVGSGVPGNGFQLQRFDMSSHTVLAGAINLGTINPCECSMGDALAPGFDVSRDGSHIVYQKVAPASSSADIPEGVGSSQFFYAHADGSGASRIASVATAHSMVKMQLSPDGRLVAVARAEPTPDVFTASVASAGLSGDPNMHFYTPDVGSYPVWKTDSATFWASGSDMEHFDVGVHAGSVGAAGGANPWYTIGG